MTTGRPSFPVGLDSLHTFDCRQCSTRTSTSRVSHQDRDELQNHGRLLHVHRSEFARVRHGDAKAKMSQGLLCKGGTTEKKDRTGELARKCNGVSASICCIAQVGMAFWKECGRAVRLGRVGSCMNICHVGLKRALDGTASSLLCS